MDHFRSHRPKQDGLVWVAMHPHPESVLAVDGDLGGEINAVAQPMRKADFDPLFHITPQGKDSKLLSQIER